MSRRIFVFGSNRLGIHGAGAARCAREEHGAQHGVGEGLTGESYALPTCSAPGVPLRLVDVAHHVRVFLAYAKANPEMTFAVTKVGCGIAGFTPGQIAPLFKGAPANCELPERWRELGDPGSPDLRVECVTEEAS